MNQLITNNEAQYLPCQLGLPENMPFDEWQSLGATLQAMGRNWQWWVGDWLNYGESRYGEKYSQAIELFPVELGTLQNCSYVAGRVETSLRSEVLSWSHHKNVAKLEPKEQKRWLKKAEKEGLTVHELSQAIKQPPAIEHQEFDSNVCTSLDQIEGKFATIYADPPWKYGNQGTRAATNNHYGTMTVAELCEMPIEQFAADDAHLHLWTTNAFLKQSFEVLEAWGFEYRSVLIWVKPQMGIGNYWRVSHEYLVLGIRGNAKRFNEKNHMSWIEESRTKHSAKPECVRQKIEAVSNGPFLELFGRKSVKGWTVFGNQVEELLV